VKSERLQEIIRKFPDCRIAVLGDYFLDKYLDVNPALAEISVETGKIAHQVISVRCAPGAAGTVINNLAALGAGRLYAVGFTGDDGEGFELRRSLRQLGCDIEGLLVHPGRFTPTYLKPRAGDTADLSGEHERYDTKNRMRTSDEIQSGLLAHLEFLLERVDAVVVVDQVEEEDCGAVTGSVRDNLAQLAGRHPEVVFWADSRRRIGSFRNVIIKVNSHEAVENTLPYGLPDGDGALGDDSVKAAMTELRKRTGRPVFVTAGRRGIWIDDEQPTLVHGLKVNEPTDPTGAGDSATAGAVLALCAGAAMHEAALLANLVASITVQQLATTGTAHPDQLGPRLRMWHSQQSS
jgi:bifunctional ADP-heptose synthase (sugar kinase/adenylyltransferase)